MPNPITITAKLGLFDHDASWCLFVYIEHIYFLLILFISAYAFQLGLLRCYYWPIFTGYILKAQSVSVLE